MIRRNGEYGKRREFRHVEKVRGFPAKKAWSGGKAA
jgi:hypothetical protein